jgi:hypothetical protein
VLDAAVHGGGLLTNSAVGNETYAYRPAPDVVRQAAAVMAKVCAARGTDLVTAAMRFSLRDPRITATITGFTKESTPARTLDALDADLSESFWEEIEGLTTDPRALARQQRANSVLARNRPTAWRGAMSAKNPLYRARQRSRMSNPATHMRATTARSESAGEPDDRVPG